MVRERDPAAGALRGRLGLTAGIAGAFLSVPVLALVRILYRRIRKARLTGRPVGPARGA